MGEQKSKKGPGRPPMERRKGKVLSTRLDADIQEAWEAFLADQPFRPVEADVLRIFIKEGLERRNYLKEKK